MPVLIDTSAFVEVVSGTPANRALFRKLFEDESPPWISTEACLTEAMHLARKREGWSGQAKLLALIQTWSVEIRCLDRRLPLLEDLMRKYQDLPMDFADGTLLVAAEQSGVRRVLTTDLRDFGVYRTRDGKPFEIVGLS